MAADGDDSHLLTLTTQIVSAYVGRQPMPQQDLRTTIRLVHETLTSLRRKGEAATAANESRMPTRPPAVPVARSITPDYLICLEDGRRLKTLKRHLRAAYGMSPEAYRARWRLPPDYPMVAPNYATRRSSIAKQQGLGQKPSRTRA
jgi:predicted transcriptional regulator